MSEHWSDTPPDRIVTMPPCPSTNRLWIRAPGKPRVRSPEYSEWITVAGWEVKRQIVGAAPIDCRFNCLIEVPISRRDTGNFEKATMDLCEHVGLLTNDGNAFEIVIRPRPRIDVMVALWCLPAMDGVRKQAAPRGGGQRAGRSWSRGKAKRAALTWLL